MTSESHCIFTFISQAPRSTWERDDEEDEGKVRVHTDRVSLTLPQPSVTNKAEGDEEQQGERGREKERDSACSWSHRSVAPSSGKDGAVSTTSADAGRETRRERGNKRGKGQKNKQERKEAGETGTKSKNALPLSPPPLSFTPSQHHTMQIGQICNTGAARLATRVHPVPARNSPVPETGKATQ